MPKTKLVGLTAPTLFASSEQSSLSPEHFIAYCARVSSPNQNNPNYTKLLEYCMREGHWSIFEMVNMVVEINTTRAIAPQILRHRSFSFQEFSQRYATAQSMEFYEARRQDNKNRQNSFADFDEDTKEWFKSAQQTVWNTSEKLYNEALSRGIAKESARNLLPLSTSTKLYMNGNIRSWIHYFRVRCDVATQLEHREIALEIRDTMFKENFPAIYSILIEMGNS